MLQFLRLIFKVENVFVCKRRLVPTKIYFEKPVDAAAHWIKKEQKLHLVDLDGAKSGKPENLECVLRSKKFPDVILQLGGRVRDLDTLGYDSGVDDVILGSIAIRIKNYSASLYNLSRENHLRYRCNKWFSSGSMDRGFKIISFRLDQLLQGALSNRYCWYQ